MRLGRIAKNLGEIALNNFHGHVAGINYGEKGEKNHLIFEESDFNYQDLLKAFKKFDIKGAIVCESPNIEIDTKIGLIVTLECQFGITTKKRFVTCAKKVFL